MLSLVLALVSSSATWQPLPHIDGSSRIRSLSSRDDTLMACGAGGCASSRDRGATWTAHPTTFLPDVQAASSGLFALTENEGRVFRSLDGGRQWSSWNEGIPDSQGASHLVVRGDVAYASTWTMRRSDGVITYTEPCGAFVRTRDAAKWTAVESSPLTECDEIAFGPGKVLLRIARRPAPGSLATIFRLERSTDQGLSWDSVIDHHHGLSDLGQGILAVLEEGTDSTLLSLDSGRTWSFRTGYIASTSSLDGAVKPSGLGRWIDPRTGTTRTFVLDSVPRVRVWARTGNVLWAKGSYGLFSSVDSGRSWSRSDHAFPLEYAPRLLTTTRSLYRVGLLGDQTTFSTSGDGGLGWTSLPGTHSTLVAPEACGDDLLAPTGSGTVVIRGDQVRLVPATSFAPELLDCSGRSHTAFDGTRLAAWSDTGWVPSPTTVRAAAYPLEIAATDNGVFFQVEGILNDREEISFLASGSDSAIRGPVLPYVRSIQGSSRGAWVSTSRGLFLCTDAIHCARAAMPAIDSNWSFLGTDVQGAFVFTSAVPIGADSWVDFSRPRLFASADSGKTWSSFDLPALVRSFQATSQGILASSYGRGLWLLDEPTFHTTSIGPRSGIRSITPLLALRGRTLVASGLIGPTSVRLLDASGRTLLDRELDVRDGTATLTLGSAPSGVLLAQVKSGALIVSQGLVAP